MPNYRLIDGSIQHKFFLSRKPIQVFGGGYGNGKTTALVIKALNVARDYPGAEILLARETYPKLNDTVRKVFKMWCPSDWVKRWPTQEDNTCYMRNGSVVNFRYIAQRGKQSADGSSTSNLLSATYDFVGIDQLEDPMITQKDFEDISGRLRGQATYRPPNGFEDPTMPDTGPRWLCVTLNPSQSWAHKRIVLPYIVWRDRGIKMENLLVDPETGLPIIDLFEGSTYTNKHNLPKDYLTRLEATYKGQARERFLLGKHAAFEGLVYGDFNEADHVLSRDAMMGHLVECKRRHVKVRAIEAYDFGVTSPTCYLLGFVDDFGRVFILDGFYKANFSYMDQPTEIRKLRMKYIGLLDFKEPIIADPAIFKSIAVEGSRGDTIRSLIEKLDNTIRFRAGMNDIAQGIAKVSAYINGLPNVPHVVTGKASGPLLYVVEDLPYEGGLNFFIDEILAYYWKKNPLGMRIDEPIGNNDHAMDAVKYMLSKLPDPSKIVPPPEKLPPGWRQWHEVEEADGLHF